jgi:hypothetical protein
VCGNIDLNTGSRLNLAPGLYVVTGNLKMSAGAILSGLGGVTIVLTGAHSTIDIGSGSELRLSAPQTGPWKNIAIAIAPQTATKVSAINGGGVFDVDGAVYAPTQELNLTGGGSLATPTDKVRVFIASTFDLNGNGAIYLNGSEELLVMPAGSRLTN